MEVTADMCRIARAFVPMALFVSVVLPTELSAQRARSAQEAFAIEAAGATAGSLVAIVAAHQIANRIQGACPVEDLGCLIKRIGVTGAASVVGAAGGGFLAGRAAETRPSGAGTVLGAVVGVATGAVATNLIAGNLDIRNRPAVALTYAIVQGLTTAAVSRAMARD